MPRTTAQYEKIRESKKALIMDTALELFASEGFHQASISKIAQKAGISKGLMYNYFKSKDELIKAIIESGFQKLFESFDPNHDEELTDNEFVFFLHENFRILKENLQYWKLYFAIVTQPQVFDLVKDSFRTVLQLFMSILVKYYKQRGAEKPEMEAMLFGALMDGISLQYIMDPDNFPLDEVIEMIIEKFSFKA